MTTVVLIFIFSAIQSFIAEARWAANCHPTTEVIP